MPGCEGWTRPRQSLVDVSAEGPGVGDPHRLVVSLAVKKPLLNFVQNKDLVWRFQICFSGRIFVLK